MISRIARTKRFPTSSALSSPPCCLCSRAAIEYTPRARRARPDFWPKVAIGLMAVVCLFEIVRAFAGCERRSARHRRRARQGERQPSRQPSLSMACSCRRHRAGCGLCGRGRNARLSARHLPVPRRLHVSRALSQSRGDLGDQRRGHAAGGADLPELRLCLAAARRAAVRSRSPTSCRIVLGG